MADRYCSQCGTQIHAGVGPAVAEECIAQVSAGSSQSHDPNVSTFHLNALLSPPPVDDQYSTVPELRGERREITVLFFDITDFTATARGMDSEDIYLIVDDTMRKLADVIHRFDGTVDKFTGDGLMAIFGAPITHEDDPVRAVYAALEMQATVNDLATQWSDIAPFQGRIGINTGPAIAGNIGNRSHLEYTVIGDTVNLASRLEGAAQPATILVSHETYLRTSHVFEYEVLPPIKVKGIDEPVLAARPAGVIKQQQSVRGFGDLPSPLVGRDNALQSATEALSSVRTADGARVIFVSGDAGYGKSRLIAELRGGAAARPFRWIEGRCLSYTQSQPYRLISDLLRNLCDINDSALPEEQEHRLRRCIARVAFDQEELLPILAPFLLMDETQQSASTFQDHVDPRQVSRPIYRAVLQMLGAQARLEPTAYICEDLQWVDPGSLEFLMFLLQNSHDFPALLVFISRDFKGDLRLNPLLDEGKRLGPRSLDLPLKPLSGRETGELIDNLIVERVNASHEVRRWLIERSGGNPFYVEELARMLAEKGGLVGAPGNWTVTDRASTILRGVPGSVKGVILSRFDQLAHPARLLLDTASVAGPIFPLQLLVDLSGLPTETIQAGLDELRKYHFLKRYPKYKEVWYAFEHTLTQEAIYDTLLKRDRQRLHGVIADAIITTGYWSHNEHPEIIAFHLSRCDEPARAIPYLLTVASRASSRGTYQLAVDHYRQALQLSHGFGYLATEQRLATEIAFAQALKFIGAYAESTQILTDVAAPFYNQSQPDELEQHLPLFIAALRELSDINTREGSYTDAITHLTMGTTFLHRVGHQSRLELLQSLQDRHAWLLFRQGALAEAARLSGQLLAELQSGDDRDSLLAASVCNTLGGVCWQQGDFQGATGYVRQSLAIYQFRNHSWGTAVAFSNLGVLHDILGDWEKAADYYRRATTIQHKLGNLEHQACSLDNLGILRTAMGDFEAAHQVLEQSKEIRSRLGDNLGLAQSYGSLAQLALAEARHAEAERYALAALSLAEAIDSKQSRVFAGWLLGAAYAKQGRLAEAASAVTDALDLARHSGCEEQIADCLRVLGEVHQLQGDIGAAVDCYQQAAQMAETQGDPHRQGLALLKLGQLYESRSQEEPARCKLTKYEAHSALNSATLLFRRLGAKHVLEIAERHLAHLDEEESRTFVRHE